MTFCKLDIAHSLFEKVSESEFLSTDFSRRENEVVFDAFRTEKPQIKHTKPRGGRFLGLREIVTAARNGQQGEFCHLDLADIAGRFAPQLHFRSGPETAPPSV